MLHRLGRNFVEFDAVFAFGGKPQNRLQMPADRLAFTVGVGCEVNFVRALCFLGEALDDCLLAGGVDIARFIVFIRCDAELFLRQIADVPARGVHLIFPLQIAGDGLRLAGRLNDDKVHIAPSRTKRPSFIF